MNPMAALHKLLNKITPRGRRVTRTLSKLRKIRDPLHESRNAADAFVTCFKGRSHARDRRDVAQALYGSPLTTEKLVAADAMIHLWRRLGILDTEKATGMPRPSSN